MTPAICKINQKYANPIQSLRRHLPAAEVRKLEAREQARLSELDGICERALRRSVSVVARPVRIPGPECEEEPR